MKIPIIALALALTFAQNIHAQIQQKTASDSIAQLQIDTTLELKFNQLGERFCAEFREVFEYQNSGILEGRLGGMAICEITKVDTLNLHELKTPGFELEKTVLDSNCFEIFWINASVKDSVLEIKLGFPFGSQFIDHKIRQNWVSTSFQEHYKDDKIVKMGLEDKNFTHSDTTNQNSNCNPPSYISQKSIEKLGYFLTGSVFFNFFIG